MGHGRRIAVIGLGYVGLPVAVAFGRLGPVVGFDINALRQALYLGAPGRSLPLFAVCRSFWPRGQNPGP